MQLDGTLAYIFATDEERVEMAKNKAAVALGRKGGKARVPKGFSSPEVMRKALETRKRNREEKAKVTNDVNVDAV